MGLSLVDFFKKKINREINGVIKADEFDALENEIDEYVLTDEVANRMENFLEEYNNYHKMNGVWISGFFGSGKSHLLKMLAILLENKEINGKKTIDMFLSKCEGNDFLQADIKKLASIPSQSILFNIDQKADVIDKTERDALVAVFVKVFDEACGYYGKQAYIAQFERQLDRDGLFEKFKDEFRKNSNQEWAFGRDRATRYYKEIDKAYNSITGQNVENILEKFRSDYHLSIEDFADNVKDYLATKPSNFRLNFFVDEVGQFIATNEKLMVNLQTVAESLETKCKGRAWVIVTAQNDMSKVLNEMENRMTSDDYTKIQDRFSIRMNLTSKNVSEVIQKRLLQKNAEAEKELAVLYNKEHDNFRTLFDFADGSQTYKNFENEKHFIDCYPFVPYQFSLFQSAIQNLSKHDAFEGRYSSVGERSMLAVFQQVAITVSNKTLGELATFDQMFDGIKLSLKTDIQNPIIKASNNLSNPFAIRVLKALFLVKYVKEFKSTVRNITILMYSNFNENIQTLNEKVQEALNVLEQESYIQRTGDLYEFLTSKEQDIETEIKGMDVDRDDIKNELQKLIFDDILGNNKIRYAETGQDYSFSRKLDGKLFSQEKELSIQIISPLNDDKDLFDETRIKTYSIQNANDLIVCLGENYKLHKDLVLYKQTYKYINENQNMHISETVKNILANKATQNRERLQQLKIRIRELVGHAKLYINGSEIEISGEEPKGKLIQGFNQLISSVYVNLKMLGDTQYKEDDIKYILANKQQILLDTGLSEVEQEVLSFIKRETDSGLRVTIKKALEKFQTKPYGWSYPAILCNIAKLCAKRKIELKEDSNILNDADLNAALTSTARQNNIILMPQLDFSPSQIRNLKDFWGEFKDEPAGDEDAKTLACNVAELLKEELIEVNSILKQIEDYPFLKVLRPVADKLNECIGKSYDWYLTTFRDYSDDLLEMKSAYIKPINNFMNGVGKEIYNAARNFLASNEANFQYINTDGVHKIKEILRDENCFKGAKIQELKDEQKKLEDLIQEKLQEERKLAHSQIDELKQKLTFMPEYEKLTEDNKKNIDKKFSDCIGSIEQTKIIAVIKDMVARFKETTYNDCISEVISFATPKPQPNVDESTTDESEVINPEPRMEKPIVLSTIKPAYSKPLVSNENEVEEYIYSLKAAMMEQINNGKRIQI